MRRALLRTSDGVAIDALYEPRRASDESFRDAAAGDGTGAEVAVGGAAAEGVAGARGGAAIVLAHGFTGDLERPHVRRIARSLARHAAVVSFSFRGHGRSGGRSTVGDREVLDLAAAVAWTRRLGHDRVITVGFSMGGSVVLRHAALHRADEPAGAPPGAQPCAAREERDGAPFVGRGVRVPAPTEPGAVERGGRTVADVSAATDAVISVSAPARWYYRGTAPMRRLHWLVTRPEGRVLGRYGFRTRIHHRDWDPVPLSPVEAVPLIAPTPLLIVHGDRDPYFPLDHPRMLAAASAGAADLWLEPGMGHAEHATDAALLSRIADWATAALPR